LAAIQKVEKSQFIFTHTFAFWWHTESTESLLSKITCDVSKIHVTRDGN